MPTCAECSGIGAQMRRFRTRLDGATAELVTDALPPGTPIVARGVPPLSRRRASAGGLLGALASTVLVAFAVVGVAVTGASVAESLHGGPRGAPDVTGHAAEAVECYLGDPAVEVNAEATVTPGGPRAVIAYCFGVVDAAEVDRARAISCARSVTAEQELRREAEAEEAPPSDASSPRYLGACTTVVEVDRTIVDPAEGLGTSVGPSVPLLTWERAASVAGWELLRPGWLPDGYQLAALQGFSSADGTEPIATVSAIYLHAGTALTVEQFLLPEPEDFRIRLTIPGEQLHGVATGQTTVADQPAFWADGVVATAGGAGLDVRALVLTWARDGIGYRITSRIDDLDVLRRVGESLAGG
ncbi:MAG TPA: hypothetical protein VHR55_02385 [Candidatus Limnocylindria bacterium]|nr:hypothetical protein [Candidatus Limnocylindria bacterium]